MIRRAKNPAGLWVGLACLFSIGIALAGCSAQAPLELAACAAALQASGEQDTGKLALLAASTPACLAASADAINATIAAAARARTQAR